MKDKMRETLQYSAFALLIILSIALLISVFFQGEPKEKKGKEIADNQQKKEQETNKQDNYKPKPEQQKDLEEKETKEKQTLNSSKNESKEKNISHSSTSNKNGVSLKYLVKNATHIFLGELKSKNSEYKKKEKAVYTHYKFKVHKNYKNSGKNFVRFKQIGGTDKGRNLRTSLSNNYVPRFSRKAKHLVFLNKDTSSSFSPIVAKRMGVFTVYDKSKSKSSSSFLMTNYGEYVSKLKGEEKLIKTSPNQKLNFRSFISYLEGFLR